MAHAGRAGANMNVFSGPNSLKDYYDPDKCPPLPLVEIPDALNPYREDGVRIWAKMMTYLPAHNVKELPALAMLSPDAVPPSAKTIVEYSSGSTVVSMGIVARVMHNIDDVRAYVSNKTSETKLRMLQFFGLDISLFAGPSQPESFDERGGIHRARLEAQASTDGTTINANQYENDANWGSHIRWTGPQLLAQLPSINVFCAGVGTAGTITGTATYLKKQKPSVKSVGVCTAPGDRVPGPRSYALLEPVTWFPWRDVVDSMEQCGSEAAFSLSMQLSRWGVVCGPSSGFNLFGLREFVRKRKEAGALDELRGENGEVHCVFICCDLPYQYLDEYFHKAPKDQFKPVRNHNLINVDLYRYDEAWELEPTSARLAQILIQLRSIEAAKTTIVLDLRQMGDSAAFRPDGIHVLNIPLSSLSSTSASPFYDSDVMVQQWCELDNLLGPKSSTGLKYTLQDKTILTLCYHGDTARVANSVLRAAGLESYSVRGGAAKLFPLLLPSSADKKPSFGVEGDVAAANSIALA